MGKHNGKARKAGLKVGAALSNRHKVRLIMTLAILYPCVKLLPCMELLDHTMLQSMHTLDRLPH